MWFPLRSYQFFISLDFRQRWAPFQWAKMRSPNKRAYIVFVTEQSVRGKRCPSIQMSTRVMFAALGVGPHRVNAYLYAAAAEKRGVVTGYGDGSNGISLWLTHRHTNTQCSLHGWQSQAGALVFLQLDPHPTASTDASKHSSKHPLRMQLHVSLKGHFFCPSHPTNTHTAAAECVLFSLLIAKYGLWTYKIILPIEVCMSLICETNAILT